MLHQTMLVWNCIQMYSKSSTSRFVLLSWIFSRNRLSSRWKIVWDTLIYYQYRKYPCSYPNICIRQIRFSFRNFVNIEWMLHKTHIMKSIIKWLNYISKDFWLTKPSPNYVYFSESWWLSFLIKAFYGTTAVYNYNDLFDLLASKFKLFEYFKSKISGRTIVI